MQITILGKSPAWQDAGGACSSYLIEHGDFAVLIDCGNGAFGKLRQFRDYVDIEAVVISHLHADHYFDLVPFSFALTHAPRQQTVDVPPWQANPSPARPRLFGPPGALTAFRAVGGLLGFEKLIENAFEAAEYEPAAGLEIGELSFEFQAVPHFVETFAIAITAPGSGRIVYGADCRPGDDLAEFAAGASLLIIEATLPRPERTGVRGHLTPAEAGEIGRRAGVERLVLTHISDEIDPEWAVAEAAKIFTGPVEIAREGRVYEA